LAVLRLALAACLAASGCGEASRSTPELHAAAGAFAAAGEKDSSSQSGGSLGSGGAPDLSVDIDSSDCAGRAVSDCAGVEALYQSNDGFGKTPAFAECQLFNSFDGCGTLEFAFDAEGCAVSVSPGAGGWKNSQHLAGLQTCLAGALQLARFPCLASSALRYQESCFVR
jgi:hypothetical protein